MRRPIFFFAATLLTFLAGCLGQDAPPAATPTPTTFWDVLLLRTPYPYTTPLPPDEATPIDGNYIKVDPKQGTPVPCRRCPDYALEGGIWRLNFRHGVYHIHHDVTQWRSIGSFSVEGNQLLLFNDPVCTDVTGVYSWEVVESRLTLELVDDPCAIGLRAMNLTRQDWLVDLPNP